MLKTLSVEKKRPAGIRRSFSSKFAGSKNKEQLELIAIMLPALIHIFIFSYIPLYGIVIAFQNYFPGNPFIAFDGSVEWVGLQNFVEFISQRTFWKLIRNTLVLSGLNLCFGFWVPILFALLLNEVKSVRYKKFVQTASYLPYFISTVVVAGMVLSFIDTQGIINTIRGLFGLAPKAYNVSPGAFPVIYTITNVWKSFGWDSILYLSAMSAVDPNLYEAARLDGANRIQQAWYVTLPSIKPTIVLLLIFAIGGVLNANSEMILLLYNPATYDTADVVGTYVYRDGLMGGRFSFGTAASLFTSAINFALIFGANWVARKVGDYSLW